MKFRFYYWQYFKVGNKINKLKLIYVNPLIRVHFMHHYWALSIAGADYAMLQGNITSI
jgi:hypothetical protein